MRSAQPPSHSSAATSSRVSTARRGAWAEVIAAERARANRRTITVWHHGSPRRTVLATPNPPFQAGRYHRAEGRPTWYGSSTEAGAWEEFVRSLPDDVDASEFQRRIGRVKFDLITLDLTSVELHKQLEIEGPGLMADDLTLCQTLADIAASTGFDAILGPSAAVTGETTLAVFGPAIESQSHDVEDLGIRTPPPNPR